MTAIDNDDVKLIELNEADVDALVTLIWRATFERMRLPLLCRKGACRRHRRCAETVRFPPGCWPSFPPLAAHTTLEVIIAATEMLSQSLDIEPPEDPAALYHQAFALDILYDCYDRGPDFAELLASTCFRYANRGEGPPTVAAFDGQIGS